MNATTRSLVAAAIVSLVSACGGKTAAPDAAAPRGDAGTSDAGTSASAPTPAAFGLLWEGNGQRLTLRGLPDTPAVLADVRERARKAGASALVIGAPGASLSDEHATALVGALLQLEDARLSVEGKSATLGGHAWSAKQRDETIATVKARLGNDVAITSELAVDGDTLRPGQGKITLVGWDKKIEDLAPRPILRNDDGSGNHLGDAVPIDEFGRIAAGLYELADATSVAVVEGAETKLVAGAPAIVAGGRRFILDDPDVPLRSMADPDGFDFAKATSPDGMPMFGSRYLRPGVRVKEDDLAMGREAITEVVLHTDLTPTAEDGFKATVARSLSQHFQIDFDGKVFQELDLLTNGFHAGDANGRSIGVLLNDVMHNLVNEKDMLPYPAGHARASEMEQHPRGGPKEATINGAKTRSWGYTEAQYRSLGAVVRRLADLFPGVGQGVPKDEAGQVPMGVMDPLPTSGVLAHWQVEAQRWDPGPGFDWARMDLELAKRIIAQHPHTSGLVPLEAHAVAARTGGKWQVRATWDRRHPDVGLVVSGIDSGGKAAEALLTRARSPGENNPTRGGGWRIELIEPGVPALDDAALGGLFDALLVLDGGTLEVAPGGITLTGTAHNAAARDTATALLSRAAGDLKPTITLSIDGKELYASEGRVVMADASPVPQLRLQRGDAAIVDEFGRVAPGVYRMPDDTDVVVRAGHETVVAPTAGVIVVAGHKLRLGDAEVKVIGAGDAKALTLPPGLERQAPKVAGAPDADGLAALQASIHFVVLRSDNENDAPAGFAKIAKSKDSSTHFLIDFDGAIFQTRDPATFGTVGNDPKSYAVELRDGVTIHLNNLMPNLVKTPKAAAYPAKHARKADMDAAPRPVSELMEINGAKVKSYGYTAAQYRALGALLRRLAELFPDIALGPARDAKGAVMPRAADVPAKGGTYAAWQVWADVWDPGPGLDWGQVEAALGKAPTP